MKVLRRITVAFAIVLGASAAFAVEPFQQFDGVGPVMAASVSQNSLPKHAVSYIKKYFPTDRIASVENDFADREYEVDMASGIELTFDRKGNIREIDAPSNLALTEKVVRSILPHSAYKILEKKSYASQIETVKKIQEGYLVDLNDRQETEIQFDRYGELVAIGCD